MAGKMRFHVNIDHIATVRNARGTRYPDPVQGAELCERAGVDGITAHLREDRRHIRDDDVTRLRQLLKVPFNLEMAATEEMRTIAERVRPDVVTLVPERREERTTEGGLDVLKAAREIEKIVRMCEASQILVSLFIAPDPEQIARSKELGVAQVELHTGEYCHFEGEQRAAELVRLAHGAHVAHELGLEVAAGHGLTQENVGKISAIPQIVELNIGHALVADAVFVGLEQAVQGFRKAIDAGVAARR